MYRDKGNPCFFFSVKIGGNESKGNGILPQVEKKINSCILADFKIRTLKEQAEEMNVFLSIFVFPKNTYMYSPQNFVFEYKNSTNSYANSI